MSTIDDVRTAEKRMQKLLNELKKISETDLSILADELRTATDDYARAIRELDVT